MEDTDFRGIVRQQWPVFEKMGWKTVSGAAKHYQTHPDEWEDAMAMARHAQRVPRRDAAQHYDAGEFVYCWHKTSYGDMRLFRLKQGVRCTHTQEQMDDQPPASEPTMAEDIQAVRQCYVGLMREFPELNDNEVIVAQVARLTGLAAYGVANVLALPTKRPAPDYVRALKSF